MPKNNPKFKNLLLISALLLLTIAASPLFYQPGLTSVAPVTPYLNYAFPSQLSSNLEWTTHDVTGINGIISTRRVPNTNSMALVRTNGNINFYDFDTNLLSDKIWNIAPDGGFTSSSSRIGLKGLAFHPEFGNPNSANRNFVYISSVTNEHTRKVSRYSVNEETNLLERDSELKMIELLGPGISYHSVGELGFGGDGFLYIPFGDGSGGGSDDVVPMIENYVQNLEGNLVGGVMRIDVNQDPVKSHPPVKKLPQTFEGETSGNGYYIPNDNPWVSPEGVNMEEYFTIGQRNPWKLAVDPLTGEVWISEVGPWNGEEVNLLQNGHNYGWPYRVGSTGEVVWDRREPTEPMPDPFIGILTEPIFSPERDQASNSYLGSVYRGTKWPEYYGKVMFADISKKNAWMVGYNKETGETAVDNLPNVPAAYTLFESPLGDIMGITTAGNIFVLERSDLNIEEFPQLLSQVGAFSSLTPLTANETLIPYTVNTPLWSDRAAKERWIVLPNDGEFDSVEEQISFESENPWEFPEGTVFIKHFKLALDENNPSETRPLETRFMIVGEEGSTYGVTYKWLPDGSDAELLFNGDQEDFQITAINGINYVQTWHYPSSSECVNCHNANAGQSLGINTQQLNGDYTYPSTGITDNQLNTLSHLNIFSTALDNSDEYIKNVPLDDAFASDELKVRSYLDANCAYCHMPGGVDAAFDARITTPLEAQGLIDQMVASAGSHSEKIIVPGDYLKSELYLRDNSVGPDAMPPLAKTMVDEEYIKVLMSWVYGLAEEPVIGEIGTVNINNEYSTVVLNKQYTNPVVIAGGASYNGAHQLAVRVNNVTGTGFDIRLDEWSCLDEWHVTETVPYLVVEAGSYRLKNGKMLQAGNIESDAGYEVFTEINFPYTFDETPVSFAQVVTERENETVAMRMNANTLGTSTMQVLVDEKDKDLSGHISERISWLAIEPGAFSEQQKFEVSTTLPQFNEVWRTLDFEQDYSNNEPIFISNIGSYFGPDAAAARYKNLSGASVQILVEEEKCGDIELLHTYAEAINYMVFEEAGNFFGEEMDYQPLIANGLNILSESLPSEGVTLFPNPVITGVPVILQFSAEQEGAAEIRVVRIDGQLVRHVSILMKKGVNNYELETNNLSSGIYVVGLNRFNQAAQYKRLLVQ
ncbi:PQQ-dependent sugar dehydrogenase [Maribacter sp. IgM3_T14_3]|uniref:PQQ-dependent sugar dehydrogenase n=1 Tax=Maribacter sp. IgM3_T14_3 TaxID=3415140 RepID=UPI003C6F708B